MHVHTASFAYPALDGTARAELGRQMRASGGIPHGVFVLDTCLRIEVAVEGDRQALEEAVSALFGDDPALDRAAVRNGEGAIVHLFRVAAGLESPILGEREILSQFRQAVGRSEREGVGGLMTKVLETAIATGRQARELLPDSPHGSLGAVAAQMVGPADRVAVLGSGLMAKAVVEGLRGLPAPPAITLLARRPDLVTIEGVDVVSFDRAPEVLATFPAVVSATSAKGRVVTDQTFTPAIGRRDDPLLLVDMAMPPDFSPDPGLPIRYVAIDDLARVAGRRPRHADADAFVHASAVDTYRRLLEHHEVGPVIGELMRMADSIVERTVERFSGRLREGEDEAVLRQAAHTVARTLLAAPVAHLRDPDRSADMVDLLAEAFGIDDG